jgi:hypothetical protein
LSSIKPFEEIKDPLLHRDIAAVFPDLREKLAAFKTELHIDSYAQMSSQSLDIEVLKEVESQLKAELAIEFDDSSKLESFSRETLMAWLKAARLELLYHNTVGSPDAILSSLELKSFPRFKVYHPDEKVRLKALEQAYREFHLHDTEIAAIEAEAVKREQSLKTKLKLVKFLTAQLSEADLQHCAYLLLQKIWPGHPIVESELDLVATPTGLYFCFPGLSEIKELDSFKNRESSAQKELIEFIKLQKRFKFEQFEHFPMFSSYDARDGEPTWLEECCAQLPELERHDVILLLNSVITFEETSHIEKYLIHDTWGHIWQHDLTDLNVLYDVMANLNRPLSPFDQIRHKDRIISVADVFVIDSDGHVQVDNGLKSRFIQTYLEQHISSIFAPIVAELTADIIEYYFWSDHESHRDLLPSSSLFKHNPTKLDFAWMDMNYFCKKIKSVHKKLLDSESTRLSFIQMLIEALKLKFSRKFNTVINLETLEQELNVHVDEFLRELQLAFELQLQQRNDSDKEFNAFDRLLSNLLRIQFASNQIIQKHFFQESAELIRMREIYNLFICIYFCADPKNHFWTLDETLVQSTLPFLNYLNTLEKQIKEST